MRRLVCFSLLLLIAFLGCETGHHEGVTGHVTLDGQPLANAEVIFTPAERGRPAIAMTDASGAYELVYTINEKGAPAGKYIVRIRTATTTPGEDGRDVQSPETVPAKYNRHSELSVVVKEGEANQFDFELQSQ
ncbi:carboxypeptidase-like regulatory domain-containing protein [Bremerella alba]|uniref:Carboxypeptidase regulatory-like domain-containing protein n=1 Tax=Bremerella alba TaxID=980252 RepID=A0A7V8V588_9BACT|nr:carboxypeptidase-like regulatory domain-containing protein [Bremerella alba]MBA2115065.1 hypothetical protein [Bremerella alba]